MRPIHILLAEDNEGDIISTLEALKEATLFKDISVVRNGEQAIQFPNKKATIPVILPTDLVSAKDVSESLKLDRFFEVVKKIEVFRTSIVHLPKDSNYVS